MCEKEGISWKIWGFFYYFCFLGSRHFILEGGTGLRAWLSAHLSCHYVQWFCTGMLASCYQMYEKKSVEESYCCLVLQELLLFLW